ncbi:MAG: Rho termination factor N-terminal domain-containing protein [Solirubrobacteraceae bacterium]
MSVLDRSALEASPLADLHAIASELSIDGYRRLRRPGLITAILAKQSGEPLPAAEPEDESPPAKPRRAPRTRRTTRASDDAAEEKDADEATPEAEVRDASGASEAESDSDGDETPARRRRGRRGGRGRSTARDEDSGAETASTERGSRTEREPRGGDDDDETSNGQLVEGVVELLAGGSGFVRVDPPQPSDDDVYISSAQVKRCELVSGDRVAGPKRAPRRSERFASLIKVETINGRPASELADSVRFDDLPAAFPEDRLKLDSDDPTLKAIEFLAPFGKGSRVTIVGASRSGKSEALKRIATVLSGDEDHAVQVVLTGARPEEISEWSGGPLAPAAAVSMAASEETQNGAVEPVIDQARRLAARGSHAIVLIDSLDGCSPTMARKALGAARNIVDGGSLTVIATSSAPVGGETTVIALDAALASLGRFPALDLLASGTLRPEMLVGQAGAEAIARARADAADRGND